MKELRSGLIFIALFIGVAGFSQERRKDEGSKEIELNSEGQQRENSPEITIRGEGGEGSGSSTTDSLRQSQSSTPVGPKTTSPSGSPGVISDEYQPDGTNTVPRAKPNIAGSKVPGSRVTPPRPKTSEKAKAGASDAVKKQK